jgi:ankyrin repeat protein
LEDGRLHDYRMMQALEQYLFRGRADEIVENDPNQEDSDASSSESGLSDCETDGDEVLSESEVSAVVQANKKKSAQRSSYERVWDFLRLYGLVSPKRADENGRSALHYAAAAGLERVIQSLVTLKAPINIAVKESAESKEENRNSSWRCCKGMTALHFSALFNFTRPAAIQLLLNLNAEVDARDERQRSPLVLAASVGNVAAAKVLLRGRARVNLPDENGLTPLALSLINGHYELTRLLLQEGAAVSKRPCGWTPLFDLAFFAIDDSAAEVVPLLVEAGVEINGALDKDLKLLDEVLHAYLAQGDLSSCTLFTLLRDQQQGLTPLMAASITGNSTLVDAMIRAGADAVRENVNGLNAKDFGRLRFPQKTGSSLARWTPLSNGSCIAVTSKSFPQQVK